MNKALAVVLCVCAAPGLRAQLDTPEKFLSQLPKGAVLRAYRPTLDGREHPLKADLHRRLAQMDDALRGMKARLGGAVKEGQAQRMEAMGVAPEVARGKKRLSKEERMAAASQMMQAQLGAGAPSAEQLKAMTPDQRRAWAASSAGPLAAAGAATAPQVAKGMPSAADIQRLQGIEQELQALAQKHRARHQRLQAEAAELAKPEGRDYSSLRGISPEAKAKAARLVAPKLAALMEEQVAELTAKLPLMKQADDLLARQNGLEKAPVPGHRAMQMIRECLAEVSETLARL